MTHEQYMDTPIAEVEWLLRIDAIHNEPPPAKSPASSGAPPQPGPPRIN